MNKRRRIRRTALLGALLATAVLPLSTPADAESVAPPTPTGVTVSSTGGEAANGPDLHVDGESGNVDDASALVRAWSGPGAARNGSRGIRLSAAEAPSYVHWYDGVFGRNHSFASTRMWVRVNSRGHGQSLDLLTIANSRNTRNFDFFVSAETGRFQWDLWRGDADRSNFVATPGRWYLVETQVEYAGTTHTADVRIDGAHQGRITSAGTHQQVSRMSIGATAAKTHAQDYDDLSLKVGDQAPGWLDQPQGGGESGVRVSWQPVTDAGSGVLEYQIWRNGRWYGWTRAGVTTYLDQSPLPGATYQLRAVDRDGNRSGWSSPVGLTTAPPPDPELGPDTTPPPTPSGVRVVRNANGTATVSWQSMVDAGGSGLKEFGIFRNGSWYGWIGAPATQWIDKNPVDGAEYVVRAYDNAGNRSGFSARVRL